MSPAKARQRPRPRHDGEKLTPLVPALLIAALAGQAYVYAFAPSSMWFLLPVAVALLLLAAYTRRWWGAFLTGWVAGISAFIPLFSWANIYAGAPPWIALALFEALFLGVFSMLARLVMIRRGLGFLTSMSVALLWAAVEYARSTVPWGGLPWAMSAFAYANAPLLNYGPWIGIVGLAVLTGLLGSLLMNALMALALRRHRHHNGVHAVWPATVIVLILLCALVVPRPAGEVPSDQQRLTVTAVQGNVDPPPPGSYYIPEEMFGNHVAATRQFLQSGQQTDLVVWPEDSTGWNLPSDSTRMATVEELSAQAGAPVIVGSQVPLGATQRLNKALMIDANGLTGQEYAKQHPVPFGEYIPARGFFSKLSDKTDLVSTDMAPGTTPGVFRVGDTRVGMLICFEIAYDDLVRSTLDSGAQVLVVQSNNALFGDSYEAIQQLDQAKVFSVVAGRSVVHVSTVGYSAIFTPDGRVLDSLDHWEQGTMTAPVPLRTGLTPAMEYGNHYVVATIALALIVLLGALLTEPRTEERPQ